MLTVDGLHTDPWDVRGFGTSGRKTAESNKTDVETSGR